MVKRGGETSTRLKVTPGREGKLLQPCHGETLALEVEEGGIGDGLRGVLLDAVAKGLLDGLLEAVLHDTGDLGALIDVVVNAATVELFNGLTVA